MYGMIYDLIKNVEWFQEIYAIVLIVPDILVIVQEKPSQNIHS